MTSGARLTGEAILADNDLREMQAVALKFMISLFAKRGLTPELSRHRFAAAARPQSYEALPTPRSGVGLNELLGASLDSWFLLYQDLVQIEEGTMARNTSVSLGDHFEQFIACQVDSGRYGSASEVVRAGLRLLETTESKLEVLRNALIAGERSGRAKYSYDSLVSELDSEQK